MPLPELLTKLEEILAPMKMLGLTARLTNSNGALPLLLQAISFFIEKTLDRLQQDDHEVFVQAFRK